VIAETIFTQQLRQHLDPATVSTEKVCADRPHVRWRETSNFTAPAGIGLKELLRQIRRMSEADQKTVNIDGFILLGYPINRVTALGGRNLAKPYKSHLYL